MKIFTDGGTCGRAALSVPRPDGDYGNLFREQDALNELVSEVNNAGYQMVLHAVGDRAVETAQNAIEYAWPEAPTCCDTASTTIGIRRPVFAVSQSTTSAMFVTPSRR